MIARRSIQELADEIMAEVQIYASAWALVGSKFDDGFAYQIAQEQRDTLKSKIRGSLTFVNKLITPL